MAKREREDRVLLNYWRSSCSWRVRMVMAHKGLEYEYKAVNLLKGEDCTPDYWKMNPAGVPTLVDGGHTITQSLAIIEYLEERYPQNPILPRAFEQRAAVRAVSHLIASGIQPLQNLGVQQKIGAQFGNDAKAKWAKDVIEEGFEGLEEALKRSAGLCCVGDSFTMADTCLVPQVFAARRFGADLSKFPTIARVAAHLDTLAAVADTHPDKMPDAVKQ
jgi:maleylacetoacetate isomerase/maleylpyruvate isomerase